MKKDKSKPQIIKKRIHSVSEEFNQRKQKYQEMKELRGLLKKRKQEVLQKQSQRKKQILENQKRREENELRSGSYDIIKNPEKMKKWKVKARRLIRKVPKDLFYNKFFNKE